MKTIELEVGQRVRHKASGQKGIVTKIHVVCTKHSTGEHLRINLTKTGIDELGPCIFDPTGTVSINTGFHEKDIDVETLLLEADLLQL